MHSSRKLLQEKLRMTMVSLPNGHLSLSDEDIVVQPARYFGRRGGLEKESQGFNEVGARLLNRGTLACNIQFGAQGDKAIIFAR
jgi:hypothetical protein